MQLHQVSQDGTSDATSTKTPFHLGLVSFLSGSVKVQSDASVALRDQCETDHHTAASTTPRLYSMPVRETRGYPSFSGHLPTTCSQPHVHLYIMHLVLFLFSCTVESKTINECKDRYEADCTRTHRLCVVVRWYSDSRQWPAPITTGCIQWD